MGRPLLLATGVVVVGVILVFLVVGLVALPTFAQEGQVAQEELAANQTIPVVPTDVESAERLVLPDANQTTDTATPSVDPGLATSNEFRQLKHTWESELFQTAVDEESTSEGKVDIIEGSVDELQDDVIALNEDEQEAYRAFAAGDITGEEFIARLAVIEQRASLLDERFEGVRSASRGITSPVVQDNVTAIQSTVGWLQLETETFNGPLRTSAWESIVGEETDPHPVSVRASQTGYVLATTDDVVFTREIYHAGNHDRAGGGFLSMEEGRERVGLLYPWTAEESFEQDPRVRGDIFREVMTHPHGTTTTYFSGATELPYREILELDLAALPTVTAAEAAEGDVVATLERTYDGGPAAVVVTTTAGDPIPDATVEIEGHGEVVTDEQGSVWFVTPDAEVSVTIHADGEQLTLEATVPVGEPPGG